MRIKTTIRGGLVLATTAGVAFSGVAWAQSPADDLSAPNTEQEQQHQRRGRHHRGHRGGAVIAQTAELTGLTPQEVVARLDDGASIAQVAVANGSSGDEVVAVMTAKIAEKLGDLVSGGRITQEMADARLAHTQEKLSEAVTVEDPAQARREARQAACEDRAHALADALGVTSDELRAARDSGQSLSEVAAAQGVDIDDVVDVLVAPLVAQLDEAVTENRITREQADERLASVEERIEHRIEDGPRRPEPRGPAAEDSAGS